MRCISALVVAVLTSVSAAAETSVPSEQAEQLTCVSCGQHHPASVDWGKLITFGRYYDIEFRPGIAPTTKEALTMRPVKIIDSAGGGWFKIEWKGMPGFKARASEAWIYLGDAIRIEEVEMKMAGQ